MLDYDYCTALLKKYMFIHCSDDFRPDLALSLQIQNSEKPKKPLITQQRRA